jgi:Fanconi anemia group M protein
MLLQFIGNLSSEMVLEISGEITPSKRKEDYPSAKIIVATPQTIDNDLTYDRFNFSNISLLCIDEVHRATGDYAYVGIAKQAKSRIIGFTATPGNSPEKILEVCENLQITRVSVTDSSDLDVKKFISTHTPKVVWIELPTQYASVIEILQKYQDELIKYLKDGLPGTFEMKYLGKREALGIHQQVVQLTKQDSSYGELLISSSNLIRIQHLRELVESQGFPQAFNAIQKWRRKSSSKALRLFLEDPQIISLENAVKNNLSIHPKLRHLIDEIAAVHSQPDSKIIIFSNFRDTIRFLHKELSEVNIETGIFVGHSSSKDDKGLTQKEQLKVIDEFKHGKLKLLLSTSVGEEGLDVGNCDLVVFYDSVPSVVRSIQRQGRGRKRKSRVIHLVTKKTRDEAMYWAIKRKNKQMSRFLKSDLPSLLENKKSQKQQGTLDQFISKKTSAEKEIKPVDSSPLIIVDTRESNSRIPKLLKEYGARLSPSELEVGDYILSNQLVVERKTYSDFVASILDGRLFQSVSPGQDSQLAKLAQQKLPLLLLQLEPDTLERQMHLNSIMGAISSIILDFRIRVVFTRSDVETATLLYQLAKREQKEFDSTISLPSLGKKEHNIREIQLFMLAVIPGINIAKAEELLKKFSSVQAIAEAEIDELMLVPKIGKKLARRIKAVFSSREETQLP